MVPKLRKAFGLLGRPRLARVAIINRVAASIEHLDAIHRAPANTLLDAGANKGQFSLAFRHVRPRATIVAFEPLPEAAKVFEKLFAGDEMTRLQRVALAGSAGSAVFYVADRADSSSLLMLGEGQDRAFRVRTNKTITVPLQRLDECIDIGGLPRPILLKVDVQGGELGVFEGCGTIGEIDYIYVELSYVELYVGQPLIGDAIAYLSAKGFQVIGIFNQVSTGEFGPTQVDVLFRRVPNRPNPRRST